MYNLLIDIDSHLLDISVTAERAKVLVDDVAQSYFGWDITSPDTAWRASPEYYRIANVKTDIASNILYELLEEIKTLQEYIDKIEVATVATDR